MTEALNRDELIGLLDGLGGEDDAAVLQAAREAHARVTAAGLSWDALLLPEAGEEADEEAEDEEAEAEETEAEAADTEPGTDAESLALIGELLARSGVSEELRAELEGYKADIAEGDFTAGDRKYLRGLHRRLSS